MKRYVKVKNGVVVHATEADSAPKGYVDAKGTRASPGWKVNGSSFSKPQKAEPGQIDNIVSRQEFIDRWTFSELVAMKKKAKSDDSAAVYWELVTVRDPLNLSSEHSIAAKALLVSWGVMTQERVNEVFS